MDKNEYNLIKNKLEELESKILNGGKGSGNFGHAGRPGEIGGSAPQGYGSSKAERRLSAMNEELVEKANSDTIQFEGGEPENLLTYGDDGRHLYEYTGVGDGVNEGKIRLGFNVQTDAPFTLDSNTQNKMDALRKEQKDGEEERQRIQGELAKMLEGKGYTYEYERWGKTIKDVLRPGAVDATDVVKSDMPSEEKIKYVKLAEEARKLGFRYTDLAEQMDMILETANYYPNKTGAKGSILISGLTKGIVNYLGQRSDGYGEGSYDWKVKEETNAKAKVYERFIDIMRSPKSVSESEFNKYRDASAELASSQAAYLKRVGKIVPEEEIVAKQMKNVAKTIKNLTRDQVIADNKTNGSETVTFRTGYPIIQKRYY